MRIQKFFLLVAGTLLLATPAFAQGSAPKVNPAKVKLMLAKTHKLLVQASASVKTGGKDKADMHKAIVSNKAAISALKKGKASIAAHLTLKARGLARAALKANSATPAPATTTDSPDETQAAATADPAAADAETQAADQATPPASDDAAVADQAADSQ